MNKKGFYLDGFEWGMLIFVGFIVIGAILGSTIVINKVYKGYHFDNKAGSYCILAEDASDIDKKIEYFDECVMRLKLLQLQGHSVWWLKKPHNKLSELYEVTDSLQKRLKNLDGMSKSTFEYQKGLEQVEEELQYFTAVGGVLLKIERKYCMENTFTKYLC